MTDRDAPDHPAGYTTKYLDDYARELAKIGERAFRRRYTTPVLIVAGRAGRASARGRSGAAAAAARKSDVRTAVERGDALRALLGQVFPLTKAAWTAPVTVQAAVQVAVQVAVIVGRTKDPGVDVTIPDLSISKRHCAFVAARDGAARVSDCGSKNGTRVNGAKLDEGSSVRLCGGEMLTLGRLELTFETAAGFAEMVSGLRVTA